MNLKNCKAQSPLLSHTIMIAFTVAIIAVVLITLGLLKSDYQQFIGDNEIQQLCALMKGGIEKIYVPDNYVSRSNETLGRIIIDLPKKIADQNYYARFVNQSLQVVSVGSLLINDTCKMGFNISFIGYTSGDRTEIKWIRYSNQTDSIEMSNV